MNSNLDTPAITESSWADTFSTEEVRKSQDTDSDIMKIIGWIEELRDRPARSDRAMKSASIGLLRLWGQWKRLELVDGVLYRKFYPDDGQPVCQLVVPETLRGILLTALHAGVSGGHLGIECTLDKVRKRCYWPFLSADVKDFCNACSVCQSRKAPVPRP